MTPHRLTLQPLHDVFAICRLQADEALPAWATAKPFFSISRTGDELSIVCLQTLVPDGVRCERGWRCFRVAGAMDFTMIGVVASLAGPLAAAGVSTFVVSTFDTDYLLVKEQDWARAVATLRAAGHIVQ